MPRVSVRTKAERTAPAAHREHPGRFALRDSLCSGGCVVEVARCALPETIKSSSRIDQPAVASEHGLVDREHLGLNGANRAAYVVETSISHTERS